MPTVQEIINNNSAKQSNATPVSTPAASSPSTIAPTAISASNIGTATPVIAPTKPTNISDKLSSIQGQALAIKERLDSQQQSEQGTTPTSPSTGTRDIRSNLLADYVSQINQGFEVSSETQALQEEAADRNLRLKNLTTQLDQYGKETKDEEYRMRQNAEGKLKGALESEITNYKYERYARPGGAADMAIEAQFALNNTEHAYELANNALSAEKEQYNSRIEGMKNIYDMLQNDLTTSEQMQFGSQLRMYENEVNNLMETKNVALERAINNGAPEDVILGIKNAKDASSVWNSAGSFGEDPNLSLARDKFAFDRQMALRKQALDEQLAAGQIKLDQYNTAVATEAKRTGMGKAVSAVDRIIANSLGLGATTGKVTGRTAGFFDLGLKTGAVGALGGGASAGPVGAAVVGAGGLLVGGIFGAAEAREQQENIAADMDFITSNLTLNKVQEAKAAGLTGTMTDKDIELIGNSADVLSSMWDKESMTFRGEPEKVRFHLDELKTTLSNNRDQLLYDPSYQEAILGNSYSQIDTFFTQQ